MKRIASGVYLLFFLFLCVVYIAACGRRGDPVLITPQEESPAGGDSSEEVKTVGPSAEESGPGVVEYPDAPSGLTGLYTGEVVILTWDDPAGGAVLSYRVYRSSGGEYSFVGHTLTPAFTDTGVEPDREYSYKISAVGNSEGPASDELRITTKAR